MSVSRDRRRTFQSCPKLLFSFLPTSILVHSVFVMPFVITPQEEPEYAHAASLRILAVGTNPIINSFPSDWGDLLLKSKYERGCFRRPSFTTPMGKTRLRDVSCWAFFPRKFPEGRGLRRSVFMVAMPLPRKLPLSAFVNTTY